jgi:hypothetical protein
MLDVGCGIGTLMTRKGRMGRGFIYFNLGNDFKRSVLSVLSAVSAFHCFDLMANGKSVLTGCNQNVRKAGLLSFAFYLLWNADDAEREDGRGFIFGWRMWDGGLLMADVRKERR